MINSASSRLAETQRQCTAITHYSCAKWPAIVEGDDGEHNDMSHSFTGPILRVVRTYACSHDFFLIPYAPPFHDIHILYDTSLISHLGDGDMLKISLTVSPVLWLAARRSHNTVSPRIRPLDIHFHSPRDDHVRHG